MALNEPGQDPDGFVIRVMDATAEQLEILVDPISVSYGNAASHEEG